MGIVEQAATASSPRDYTIASQQLRQLRTLTPCYEASYAIPCQISVTQYAEYASREAKGVGIDGVTLKIGK
jgi:hypothetical protein